MVSMDFEKIQNTAAVAAHGVTLIPSVVAASGSIQSDAVALSSTFNVIGTVAAGTGVRVSSTINELQFIYNAGASDLKVYPLVGMTLAPMTQNTALTLLSGHSVGIIVTSTTQGYVVFNSSTFG